MAHLWRCQSGESRADRSDSGFVLITLALLIIPIMIFASLAVDVSSWYNRASQLQKAADAAALTGVVWMPDLSTASTQALNSLSQNNITPSTTIDVNIKPGAKPNAINVCVTDKSVTQFFSVIFAKPQTLRRCATAQYNLPLQLGSPLNYFGGDSTVSFGTVSTTPAAYSTTRPPYANFQGNQYCRVVINGSRKGYWDNKNSTNTSKWTWQSDNHNYNIPDCWPDAPVPNPFPVSKSPGFWAAIEGPATNAVNGDAYSPFCYGNSGCGPSSQSNPQFRTQPARDSGDNASGYWYTFKPTVSGPVRVQVFDGQFSGNTGQQNGTGDNFLDGSSDNFTTTYTVYNTDNTPLDITDNNTKLCQVSVIDDATYKNVWKDICSTSGLSATAGGMYVLNVRTSDPNWKGNGSNNYALRTVSTTNGTMNADCTAANQGPDLNCYGGVGGGVSGVTAIAQPSLAAWGDMAMYNNIKVPPGGGTAEFYLANVLPEYAGSTLAIDLWDPGDANGDVSVSVMAPSTGSVDGAVVGSCAYSRNLINTAAGQGALDSSKTGFPNSVANQSPCTIATTKGGATSPFNGKWLHIKVPIPSDYGKPAPGSMPCDKTVADPTKTPGSCWWQIEYYTSGTTHDNTTWSAHIEGNPVRLTE